MRAGTANHLHAVVAGMRLDNLGDTERQPTRVGEPDRHPLTERGVIKPRLLHEPQPVPLSAKPAVQPVDSAGAATKNIANYGAVS